VEDLGGLEMEGTVVNGRVEGEDLGEFVMEEEIVKIRWLLTAQRKSSFNPS